MQGLETVLRTILVESLREGAQGLPMDANGCLGRGWPCCVQRGFSNEFFDTPLPTGSSREVVYTEPRWM